MKAFFSILTVILSISVTQAKWDPNAGYIPPISQTAQIITSSGSNAANIVDGKLETFWQSTSPLPDNYLGRKDINIFLNKKSFNIFDNADAVFAFDGNASTKTRIGTGNLKIEFNKPEPLKLLSLKINTAQKVSITINFLNTKEVYYYEPSENYQLKAIPISNDSTVTSIILSSAVEFEVFEVAGIVKNPTEEVIFKFQDEQNVGWIGSKNYNGEGVISISVLTSTDNQRWRKVLSLNPNTTTFSVQLIQPQVKVKYVKVLFELTPGNYQKAILQEFEIYDKYGPYGPPLAAYPSGSTFSECFGINAIWGWGYNISSTQLGKNVGAFRFNKVAQLVRNYHSLDWDIKKTSDNPGYDNMEKGNGTSAIRWVNWYSEYGMWQEAGFKIDVCLMFNNQYFPDTLWKNPKSEASMFGQYFGDYFVRKHNLISVVEIGNEPWEYSKVKYREILEGMSSSFASISNEIEILPCAVQVWDKKNGYGNYITSYLTKKNIRNLTGLNTHVYSYINGYAGNKIALNPEDPRSEVWSINNLTKYSKQNMSSVPVYVTEFGYDSDGGGDDCIHSNCVSEIEQAIYGVRMALILYRLGVKEFYWYYYSNVDAGSVMHNRSGLVSSYSSGMKTKEAFRSFEKLQKNIGDLYFLGIINESEESYIYSYGNKNGEVKAIIAWKPTASEHYNGSWVEFPLDRNILEAKSIIVGNGFNEPSYVKTIDGLKIFLTGNPVIYHLR